MPLSDKTQTINGLAVHYWEDGDKNGYPILLLHGGIGDARLHWAGIMPALSDEYHVIAPDLPGFGSAPINGGLDAHVEWIHALLAALNIEAAVLLGNSFGGLLVRAFATRYPSHVPAAIIVNGGILPNIPPFFALLARLPLVGTLLFNAIGSSACSRDSLDKMLHVKSVMTDEFVQRAATFSQSFGRMLRLIAANPLPTELSPSVPTLVMWGLEDKVATPDEGRHLQKSIPGAKLAEIEACGHMPQLEEPDVFTVQVKNYLYQIRNPRATKLPGVGRLG
ncbi:MAG: alpha/beta hydrolase [Anaerolineae bacterium]